MRSMTFEDWTEHRVETIANGAAADMVAKAKASGAKVKRVPKPGSLNYSTLIMRWSAGSWAASVEMKKKFLEAL